MAVEISGVTFSPSDELLTCARLDYPRTGRVDGFAFEVFGWVVGKAPIAEVEFVHEQSVVGRCELTVSRPDVAKEYGCSSQVGFRKAIGTVGLAPAFTIGIRVVFEDGRRREIAEISGTQQLTSAFTPSMQPITVTSPGRSGSTWLMRMLAEHPDIIVHERFPHEFRICGYWMHFIQVLASPAYPSQVESFEFWTNRERLPAFPYYFIGSDQIEKFASMAQDTVESFYREHARGRKSTTPAFFAEKSTTADHIRRIMWQLYPRTREIFLVRDPRDTLVSVLAFHAKQGLNEFAGQAVETDEQLVGFVRSSILSLTQLWKSRSQYAALVHYEDLILSPNEHIPAMLDALELDSSPTIVDAMVNAGNETTADLKAHKTSPDARLSIGRWKRDLDPRMQKICEEAFDGLLEELGGSSV
jgi:Sulfotransferase family